MVSAVVSTGRAPLPADGNVGFDFWSDGIDAVTDETGQSSVTARHQFQYAAGFEFEAAPKLTLLVNMLGRHILGAGRIGIKKRSRCRISSRRSMWASRPKKTSSSYHSKGRRPG